MNTEIITISAPFGAYPHSVEAVFGDTANPERRRVPLTADCWREDGTQDTEETDRLVMQSIGEGVAL